jgi:Uma2 family endonuclease
MTATLTAPKRKDIERADESDESRQRWRVSREEYYRLEELGFFQGKRVERIHGEIFVVSPQGRNHWLAIELTRDALRKVFRDGFFVSGASPFPTEDSDPEPDVTVVPGKPRDYSDHRARLALAVEVSASSLRYDTNDKARLYASSGILDYWVIDLKHNQVIVFRNPSEDEQSETGFSYSSRTTYDANQRIVPLAAPGGVSIAVADLLP